MPKSSSMTMVPQTSLVHKTEQVIGRSYDWILRKKNSVSSEFQKVSLLKDLLKTALISRVYVQTFRCKHFNWKNVATADMSLWRWSFGKLEPQKRTYYNFFFFKLHFNRIKGYFGLKQVDEGRITIVESWSFERASARMTRGHRSKRWPLVNLLVARF